MARATEMSQEDIDAKLAAMEVEPESEEVEVEPEDNEVEEEEESAASEDDTDEDEPLASEGDDEEDEEDEELDLSKSEAGLLATAKAERVKRQETERKLEEIQATLAQLNEAVVSQKKPGTLEEAYDRDEKGVIDNINVNIANAVENNDVLEAERLRDLKETLRSGKMKRAQEAQQTQQQQTEIVTQLNLSVPGFTTDPNKAKELTDFALKHMGFTDEELTRKTSIPHLGMEAVREIARIEKAFQQSQVPGKAKKKKVKKATSVEKSGKGIKKTVKDADALIKEARKTGDWSKVIEGRFG